MSMQKFIMKNRKLANFMMSHMPESVHQKKGRKLAIKTAKTALNRTRAYPKILKEHKIQIREIKIFDDFLKLPIIDKRTYVDYKKNSLADLVLDGKLTNAYTIEKSSGHSGKSYYWARLPEEDEMFPIYLDFAFTQFYGVNKKSTLVLMTLALGTWTSGEKMAQALREIAAKKKYPLTIMTPGTKIEEILEIVKDLSENYQQTIIVGYPPFIKTVLDEGIKDNLDWKKYNIRIGLGGEGYSEAWRSHIAEIVGVNPDKDPLAISGGYGAADIGMNVGREYPLTVLIRRLCQKDKKLANRVFKCDLNGGSLPSLLQYNPGNVYIEEIGGELVFTALAGVPIVRYNIHDRGGVISFQDMMDTLIEFGYNPHEMLYKSGYTKNDLWRLPFFYCFGRSDGTVSIVGANIYPENIEIVLSDAHDMEIAGFKIALDTDNDHKQRPIIHLEHMKESLTESETNELMLKYYEILVKGLRKVNKDFEDAHNDNPHAANPIIRIHSKGKGPFTEDKGQIKRRYIY